MMNRKEIDKIWCEQHPVLLWIFLTSLILSLDLILRDTTGWGSNPSLIWWKYANAMLIASAVIAGQALRRRKDRRSAEQTSGGYSRSAQNPQK